MAQRRGAQAAALDDQTGRADGEAAHRRYRRPAEASYPGGADLSPPLRGRLGHVPWTGFPLSQLLKIAEPMTSAKYVVFETAQDKVMEGLNAPFYTFPYIEAVTIDEAANDLAFISTGLYGKPLPQNGGPIRLTLPWKYGFKSAKAPIKISFVEKRPATFWESIGPSEYGFWANVNPAFPHPRWRQASERLLGNDERVPTRIFNGYAEQVAGLYNDRKTEKLFM
jgi:methionine sulfoxide reductase catalytic subunit